MVVKVYRLQTSSHFLQLIFHLHWQQWPSWCCPNILHSHQNMTFHRCGSMETPVVMHCFRKRYGKPTGSVLRLASLIKSSTRVTRVMIWKHQLFEKIQRNGIEPCIVYRCQTVPNRYLDCRIEALQKILFAELRLIDELLSIIQKRA